MATIFCIIWFSIFSVRLLGFMFLTEAKARDFIRHPRLEFILWTVCLSWLINTLINIG